MRIVPLLAAAKKETLTDYLLKIVSFCFAFCIRLVDVRGWYPGLLLCIYFQHALLLLPVEGEFNFLQVIFASETTGVENFIVVRAKLDCISFLDVTDKVFSPVLLEGVGHRLLQHRNVGRADLVRAFLARLDDISDFDRRASPNLAFGRAAHVVGKYIHSHGSCGRHCYRSAQSFIAP